MDTGDNLLRILKTRLDNVIFRLGFAESRPQARQMVVHGYFLVNGKKVDIPSYLVKAGDVIIVKQRSKKIEKLKTLAENFNGTVPNWLSADIENLEGKIVTLPSREDVDLPIEEHLIIELYSR